MNKKINCPKCGSSITVKNGKRNGGMQSHLCCQCGYQYTKGLTYSTEHRIIAIALHNMGLSSALISALLGANIHTVCRWVRIYKNVDVVVDHEKLKSFVMESLKHCKLSERQHKTIDAFLDLLR
jgi:hypothetical protein